MPQHQTAAESNNRRTEVGDVAAFSGTVPVLRLPLVLLPHVVQPMQLRSEAARRSLLRTGEHGLVAVIPPEADSLPEMVCLARVTSLDESSAQNEAAPLPASGETVALRGIIRGRVLSRDGKEDASFTRVRVEAVPDRYPSHPAIDRARRRSELLHRFYELFPSPSLRETLGVLLEDELPLGVLCDLLAHAARMTDIEAADVLNELNVDARTDLVLMALQRQLRRQQAEGTVFAPRFSAN